MEDKTYSVVLEGVDALDLSVSVLRDLCDLLIEGAQRSARLMGEGRSVARGAVPAWVNAAADVRVSSFDRGSLNLGVRAPRLVDVAPEVFAAQPFPAGTEADASAMDLLLDAFNDAVQGNRDSERLDAGVLEVLARSGQLFTRGEMRLTFHRPGRSSVVIANESAATIRKLAEETPERRVARVKGVLDTLTVSTRTLAMRLDDGRTLRGFAGAVDLEELKALLGAPAVLEGWFTFRPSGQALRVEVDSAKAATERDVIWAQLPKAEATTPRARTTGAPNTLDALFGAWPGDEDDAQLTAALRELS